MLESSVIEGTNVVTATYEGALGAEEVETVRQQLSDLIAQHGKARLLVQFGDVDLGRVEPEAVWKDLKSIGMLDDLDRVAMVTDAGWADKFSSFADKVTPFELKVYGTQSRDAAVAWLNG